MLTVLRRFWNWLFPPQLPGKCRLCREDPIYQDGLCKGCFKGSVW